MMPSRNLRLVALSLSATSLRANSRFSSSPMTRFLVLFHGELYSTFYFSHCLFHIDFGPEGVASFVDLRTIFYNRCLFYAIEDVPAARAHA